jgi:DNA-binding NarL/FixJ family response regulator
MCPGSFDFKLSTCKGAWMNILLADDQMRVRFALRVLLDQQRGLTIVGEASDAQELLTQAGLTSPDLVLLDWNLPGMPLGELVRSLRSQAPSVQIIALGEQQELRQFALSAGADAFASKTNPPEQLLTVIQSCWHQHGISGGEPKPRPSFQT